MDDIIERIEELEHLMNKTMKRLGSLEDWRRGIQIRNATKGANRTNTTRKRNDPPWHKNVNALMRTNPSMPYLRALNKAKAAYNRHIKPKATIRNRHRFHLSTIHEGPENNN
jgi:hypothetical protein